MEPHLAQRQSSRKDVYDHGDEILSARDAFVAVDKDGNGFITSTELGSALQAAGFKLPNFELRRLISNYDLDSEGEGKGKLQLEEFEKLYNDFTSQDVSKAFKKQVVKATDVEKRGGTSEASVMGTTHSVKQEEEAAFANWINVNLASDLDLKHLLPVAVDGKSLYSKVHDGILLCKLVNHSMPGTVDERAINKRSLNVYRRRENLTLALNSAQAIGCNTVNIGPEDLEAGTAHLVLGLVWQVIRIGLFSHITLQEVPGLVTLLRPDETLEDVKKLTPEQILLRWVNHHLSNAGVERRVNNFTSDIQDSEVYTHLLRQIAPLEARINTSALHERDHLRRAELMLTEADKIGCRQFLRPDDVVAGNAKLNLAFVANLFNSYPALEKPEEMPEWMEDMREETREETTYRNWMNSMGVKPHVNWLYSDLADGVVIFQLFDVIDDDVVDWSRVHVKFSAMRGFMQRLENCNYVVDLGKKKLGFSLVGIGGNNIMEGNETLTLALIWQLMKAYTLSILTQLTDSGHPIVEKEIIAWANHKLSESDKRSKINSFQDPTISDARVIIDLVDAICPDSVDYSQVKEATTDEDKLDNAKYAISMARKTGARIYALPEDIVEVKPKMVMIVFACLMGRDYKPSMGGNQEEEPE